jgi:hypothetical protein
LNQENLKKWLVIEDGKIIGDFSTLKEIIRELTTVHRISRQLYSNGKVYYGTAKSLRLNGFKIPLE